MDNKQNQQNQPNSGASSSSSSAANKPASQSSASASTTSGSSASGNQSGSNSATSGRQNQQPASAATSASSRQPQPEAQNKASNPTASSTDTGTSENKSGQQQDSQRKSWLDQDQWAKSVDQLPQSLKDFGSKAMEQVNSLSTTQKVVGGALLVSGLSWLAMRGKGSKSSSADTSRYTPKGESKWKSSSESVYRGTTSSLRDDANDTSF